MRAEPISRPIPALVAQGPQMSWSLTFRMSHSMLRMLRWVCACVWKGRGGGGGGGVTCRRAPVSRRCGEVTENTTVNDLVVEFPAAAVGLEAPDPPVCFPPKRHRGATVTNIPDDPDLRAECCGCCGG